MTSKINQTIPTVDLKDPDAPLKIDSALRSHGLFFLTGHGISRESIEELKSTSREFFNLSFEKKTNLLPISPQIMRGYRAQGADALSYSRGQISPPDLNESFQVGPTDNIWPEYPLAFKVIWTAYYAEMERIAANLLQYMAQALGIDEEFFLHKHNNCTSRLRARYYPAQTSEPLPDQLRAGAHTDYVTISILLIEDLPGGLQLCLKSGEWIDVRTTESTLVVNTGDLMTLWTNDQWIAPLHRVANPPRESASINRLSHIFFHSPSADTIIECLPACCMERTPLYPTITAGEYVQSKLMKAQSLKDNQIA